MPVSRGTGPWPTAGTRALAVLGWPVAHSLSPVMHNAALAAQGLDLVYLALPVPPDALPDAVHALGQVGLVGANVTVPHKQAVMTSCDDLTEEARLVGAVNTLTWADGVLTGHNTDAVGLQWALVEAGATDGGAAVILGTGGAARAAVVACVRQGMAVTVVGRRPDAARDVAEVGLAAGGTARSLAVDDHAVVDAVADAAVVLNATPLGMQREDLPNPFMDLHPGQLAYDLVYTPPDTPFLLAATSAGARAEHGLSMLVHQAAVAYEGWTGEAAPVEVMRSAAEAALAG